MRILLVWPRPSNLIFEEYNPDRSYLAKFMSRFLSFPKPLTLPLLAAATPEKYEVDIAEGGPRDIDFNKNYDLVGITCTTRYALWAYEVADEFRKRGAFVVIGGWHASALPYEALDHCDSVVVGEADEIWPQFLKDFEDNNTKKIYYPEKPVDVSKLAHPENIYPDGPILGIQATRGCPYGCEFCAITNMVFRNKFRKRPVDEVIEEIKNLPGRNFNFHDNSLTIDHDYTKKLFAAMKDLDKKFYAFGNINNLGGDEELLKLASEAGCVGWLIGFESVSQESIDIIGKSTNTVEEYHKSVKKIHDYGMIILGSFVFGFDGDKIDTFGLTNDFVSESEIDVPDAMILTPYPGTPLFDRLLKEDRILTKDWSKYNFENVVFKPKHMTPEELLENTRDLYNGWHKWGPSIFRMMKGFRFGLTGFFENWQQNIYLKLLRYQQK